MYEFHGWFVLAESPSESDTGSLAPTIHDLKELIGRAQWPAMTAGIKTFNGEEFLTIDGLANRQRDEADLLDEVLRFLARRLPGSYGVLYDRDDELTVPPGPNAFRVRVLRRGTVTEETDHFLSPCQPLIED